MGKAYDTRMPEEILAEDRFAPFRAAPRLSEIGLRELRSFDRFLVHAEARGLTAPAPQDFLRFVEDDRSPRRLEDLRFALDRLAPETAPVHEAIRAAICEKRGGAVRTCDMRSRAARAALAADPLMAPYRDLPAFETVALEDLRVLARFLLFAEARRVEVPSVEDYLAFCVDVASSRRLRSLKAALDALLPDSPAVHVVLAEAIRLKAPPRPSKAGTAPRPAARRRVPTRDLPAEWRALLGRMRLGAMPGGGRAPAASVIDGMEDVLRQYIHVQAQEGLPPAITVEGVRRLAASCARHAASREAPAWSDHGDRPATRHTAVMRLRTFAEALGVEPLVVSALREHERVLRRELDAVVPLKHGRLDAMPDLAETWSLATRLLEEGRRTERRRSRLRLTNEAAELALWTFLPLRLADGQLRWGEHVAWSGARWSIDILTHKEEVPLRGRLHERLTPFLDALVLRGMDPDWLPDLRLRACEERLPLLRDVDGRMLAGGYPSTVWRKHMGTGAHIARTRIHTELGRLGPEGVDGALALCAQQDPRSRRSYQGDAVRRAQQERGQDMVDAMIDDLGPSRD